MKITIIVPTYNEENDIEDTLESLISLEYDDKEIIILDDSTDNTPDIVKLYKDRGVQLIHPAGGGRCEARNLGINKAKGEIVCILNADVRPRSDYLLRILEHYKMGADYVLVSAEVSNQEDLFARYISSVADMRFNKNVDISKKEWTEGFSCLKNIAINAGLFPVGYSMPICAGEDGFFGEGLNDYGANKVVDFSIVVDHVAPAKFKEYWVIRKGRGAGSAQIHRFINKWSFGKLILWNSLKTIKTFLLFATIFPEMYYCWKVTSYSKNGAKDLLPFMYAAFVEKMAFHVGEWQTVAELIKRESKNVT